MMELFDYQKEMVERIGEGFWKAPIRHGSNADGNGENVSACSSSEE